MHFFFLHHVRVVLLTTVSGVGGERVAGFRRQEGRVVDVGPSDRGEPCCCNDSALRVHWSRSLLRRETERKEVGLLAEEEVRSSHSYSSRPRGSTATRPARVIDPDTHEYSVSAPKFVGTRRRHAWLCDVRVRAAPLLGWLGPINFRLQLFFRRGPAI